MIAGTARGTLRRKRGGRDGRAALWEGDRSAAQESGAGNADLARGDFREGAIIGARQPAGHASGGADAR